MSDMLLCMRTTIKLDDEIFRAYKQRAAARGTTFAQEVEDVLRADLNARRELVAHEPFETLVFDGDGSPALIDINDNRALQQLMDEEDAGGRR
jgi:plasmid stability protein